MVEPPRVVERGVDNGHFWKNAFLTHFSPIFAPKTAPLQITLGFSVGQSPSKWAHKCAKNTCLSIPNGPGSHLENCVFDPFLNHFCFHNRPFSRHFGIFHGPKRVITASKRPKNICLSISNGARSLLEKCVFDPFLTHFCSQNGPFSMHFGILRGPKRATAGSKRPKNTCLSIPSGPGSFVDRLFFSPWGPWWTHRRPQPCAGWAALRLH